MGLEISPDVLVGDLTVAQQQIVEIAKALASDSQLIIMDEPTSALSKEEAERLFNIMRKLKEEGISIIFITHRLEEVFSVADRIVVLRDGQRVGELSCEETEINEVIRLMVGRDVRVTPRTDVSAENVILEVRNLSRSTLIKDVSFSLKKGEVLGVAGLIGAGRTEIMRVLFGVDPKTSGEVFIEGEKVEIESPTDAVRAGIGLVPEDRKFQGLILNMAVYENISLPSLPFMFANGIIDFEKEYSLAESLVSRLSIRTPSIFQIVNNLSGGNQQKVVLAKWLALKPRF